jgi:hypothetical protein
MKNKMKNAGRMPALQNGAWYRPRKDRRAEPKGVRERKSRIGALRFAAKEKSPEEPGHTF